jgi:hypothetical protein
MTDEAHRFGEDSICLPSASLFVCFYYVRGMILIWLLHAPLIIIFLVRFTSFAFSFYCQIHAWNYALVFCAPQLWYIILSSFFFFFSDDTIVVCFQNRFGKQGSIICWFQRDICLISCRTHHLELNMMTSPNGYGSAEHYKFHIGLRDFGFFLFF